MSNKLNVGFITSKSGRWPQELPDKRFKEYGDWVNANLDANIVMTEGVCVDQASIAKAVEKFKSNSVDVVLMVYGAFTGDDVATYIGQELKKPVILWAPYEPPFDGNRLYGNALVAMTMNAASMYRLGYSFHAVLGSCDDPRATDEIKGWIKTYSVIKELNGTTLGLIGYRPTAFYNSAFDEGLIRRTFGIKMEETDLKVVFDNMAAMDGAAVQAEMDLVNRNFKVAAMPEGHLENHAKLYHAMKKTVKDAGYDYVTLKCWPEMGNLKTTPCAVMGRLNDDGVFIGCEGDVDATLASIVQNKLTGKPPFITDLINIDEEANTVAFWHCGQAAPSLYDRLEGMGDHPLAGQGTALLGTLKPGKVTVARLCNMNGVYKLFVVKGEAVPTKYALKGAMVNVRLDMPVRDFIYKIIEKGIPHHYSVVWDDVADDMIRIAKVLGIEVFEF